MRRIPADSFPRVWDVREASLLCSNHGKLLCSNHGKTVSAARLKGAKMMGKIDEDLADFILEVLTTVYASEETARFNGEAAKRGITVEQLAASALAR